ncbi:MAG: N-6 DNA methylase [Methylococcaceae bacterium]
MLDNVTKRRIDTARDILVGKVPDPKSQVEQITIALIYKFMDDMDAEAEELGGKRKFFTGDFARYGWAKLMSAGIGGHELIGLYSEGIATMPQNPGIPPLFRDIFKNAYLPYRDPETLKSFLKIIDEFSYDHSERLGDAYEYLLSVLGSQGDAGQFRTPRHIIDFMVEILDPKKNETMGDTACGTAGFLISGYKHILKCNSTDYKPKQAHQATAEKDVPLELLALESPLHYKGDLLTPDERKQLAGNIKGYDISPDMVRMSLVNLYLHGFNDPHIIEYDTLTSEERWDEYFDVIFANPPFMSPKGGIKPHKRFSIQAKRSEVLFVDYIAEHLTPSGRAGIIVPEGIIFQSQTAYKALRKMLVDTSLVAVISLPAGVFQPYSGVKTSILIMDKSLAKQSDSIAFFKIDNDGFGLGAQRRAIVGEQLTQVKVELAVYMLALRDQQPTDKLQPTLGLIVPKEKITANGDYNLSGERYRVENEKETIFPRVPLKEVCTLITDGNWIESKDQSPNGIRLIQTGNVGIGEYLDKDSKARFISEETFNRLQCTEVFEGDVLVSRLPDPVGRACMLPAMRGRAITEVDCSILRFDPVRFIDTLFPYYTQSAAYYRQLEAFLTGASRSRISRKNLEAIKIPLPPLEVQEEIVAEIDGYKKVINGARAVLDNYRPHIPIHSDWPMVTIGAISTIVRGSSPRPQGDPKFFIGPVPRLMVADITRDGMYVTPQIDSLTEEGATKSRPMKKGEVIITVSGNPGLPTILAIDACIHDGFVGLRDLNKDVLPEYLYFSLLALHSQHGSQSVGAVFKNLTTDQIRDFNISLPPLATQQAIVAEIEAEQVLVAANRELITRFEKKIQATLTRVWGEEV